MYVELYDVNVLGHGLMGVRNFRLIDEYMKIQRWFNIV